VATTVVTAGLGVAGVWAAYTDDLTGLHLTSDEMTNATCIGCHGQMADEATPLDPMTFSAHKVHLRSAHLCFQTMEYGCATCHECTDLWEGSGAAVNRQVDIALCVSCHGTFTVSKHGSDFARLSPRGCSARGCHNKNGPHDPAARHAEVEYVNVSNTASRSYCIQCHGGIALFAVEETN
jgi:hypothetical protein